MDVAGWLRNLGLDKYEAAFRENGIDEYVLRHLTADDLSEIGVTTVGDRRKLLAAITELAGPSPSTESHPPSNSAERSKIPEIPAERRPITVMFCDLVGSTSLAAKLDPEDWRDLISAYLDAASAAVTELGGHVLKKLGDGLMALFGYPRAQENDSERAVRAALLIQRALAELNRKNAGVGTPELVARIGIESGPVVVEATGEVFGDAPNIAARVQAAAEPGTVMITARVQRQTAGLFVAEDCGQHGLKGTREPTTLFRIVRASGGRRFGARALTPLVGRAEELDLLRRRWERAAGGEGQFVQIVGEPGIGKSRLIEEFRAKLGEAPHTFVEWSSSQLLQNTPLHPVAEWGRQRFGGVETMAHERLADLENTLGLIGLDPAEYVPLLAPLVDIPLPEESAAKLAPEELRRRQLAALTTWVLAGARSQAVVLAFEDLHWADPTSLDLMTQLAERGAPAPLFIIATARPEFRPPWSVRSHHSVVSLEPLDRANVARMVGELAHRHALSQEVVDGVSERTGGVPLFVEEVTRLLLERGEAGGLQAIPPTLQQSLAARLDRLGEAREVAQVGAVLGRDFSYGLLAAVDDRGPGGGVVDPALQRALDRLAGANLLVAEGAGRRATYRFKHALIQDAAYDSLLKSRRKTLHRRAAELLRDDPERAAAESEVIAHHFTQAGLDDLAIEWWGKAGDQALRRSAFQEAIAHLGRAIEMADRAGGKAVGVSGQWPQLHVAYGNALFAARGPGAPETAQAFARAHESAVGDNAAHERLSADFGLWVGSYVHGELAAMREHSAAFLSDVERRPDSPEAGVAHRMAGITHWFAGEHREARDHLERALILFQPGRDDDLAFRFGHDAGVAAMLCLALALWPLGDIGRAISLVADAAARSAGLAHIATRAHGKQHAALFELMRGDLSRVASNAIELARLAREHDLPHWLAYGVFFESVASAESGASRGGLDAVRHGAKLLRDRNAQSFDGLIQIALSEAEARAGDVDRALAGVNEALTTSEQTGHRTFDAELHRVRGEMLLRRDPADPTLAEEALQTAIAVAKRQGTRSFELRAALSLAKLYEFTRRPADAHAVLALALDGFSPTAEMPEIAEAQALLAALAAADEVKDAAASRQRRLQLQTSYSKALMWSQGYGSEEAKAAFARALELAKGVDKAAERFEAYYGLCVGSLMRGELRSARETAETFLRETEPGERATEAAAAARRCLGTACLFQGDLAVARAHFEQALRIFDPERDREAKFRFGHDTGVVATVYLALAHWLLGEEPARKLIEAAIARAIESAHAPTLAIAYWFKALFDAVRDDADAGRRAADSLLEVGRRHGLSQYLAQGALFSGWARARLGDPVTGMTELLLALAAYADQGNKLFAPFFQGRLAEFEAVEQDAEGALARIDGALALAEQTGEHWTDAFLHRIRGDILVKTDRENPARAKDAYLAAIVSAQQQGARSFGLQAALKLAKLYQATARPADAHAVLAPALEGFLPTPEMPEIAEAQALMESLA